MKPSRPAIVALALLSTPGLSQTNGVREETLDVPSLTMSDDAFLQGDTGGATPVTLTGKLSLPSSSPPFPSVVLLHGSGGPGGAQMPHWSRHLGTIGVAVFSLDSYTGRGLDEVFTDQGRLGILSPIYDLYRAVDVLSDRPDIDPDRIAVIGFSRGGVGALYSSMTRFEEIYGSERATLAAHLPFYPPCNFKLDREMEVGDAPIRAFHGLADDWNPVDPCRDYIGRLAAAGHDASITEYPNAQHVFDNPGGPAYFVVGEAQTSRNCMRREESGRLLDDSTGKPFGWDADCVETGPAQQYDRNAGEAVLQAVSEVLGEVFGLN